jgi:hypothetical protein
MAHMYSLLTTASKASYHLCSTNLVLSFSCNQNGTGVAHTHISKLVEYCLLIAANQYSSTMKRQKLYYPICSTNSAHSFDCNHNRTGAAHTAKFQVDQNIVCCLLSYVDH